MCCSSNSMESIPSLLLKSPLLIQHPYIPIFIQAASYVFPFSLTIGLLRFVFWRLWSPYSLCCRPAQLKCAPMLTISSSSPPLGVQILVESSGILTMTPCRRRSLYHSSCRSICLVSLDAPCPKLQVVETFAGTTIWRNPHPAVAVGYSSSFSTDARNCIDIILI